MCMFEEQADSVPRIPTLDSTTGGLLREKEKKVRGVWKIEIEEVCASECVCV